MMLLIEMSWEKYKWLEMAMGGWCRECYFVHARASGDLATRRTHHFFDASVQQQVGNTVLLTDNFPERNLFCKWIRKNID